MLRLNGRKVEVDSFPDGTLLVKRDFGLETRPETVIDWYYESDAELFTLYALTRHMQKLGHGVRLFMPYIPNARMDRVKGASDVFTLKYFAEILNSLHFESVTVLDPHSYVSEALIDHIVVMHPKKYIYDVVTKLEDANLVMFYPDEGATKRYADMFNIPYAFGMKKRDWQTGKILGLEVMGESARVAGNNVLIVDDICSRGGTFFHSAKALKAIGAEKIYLFVTHCENTILEGEVLTSGLIERVYTTNSICTVKHEKVEVAVL